MPFRSAASRAAGYCGKLQKLNRRPNRKYRSSVSRLGALTPAIWAKPPKLFTVPSEFNCILETFEPGVEKCGVLVRLKDSARTCNL